MGPGVRRDDGYFRITAYRYLRSTAMVRLAKLSRSAITETKYVSSFWLNAGSSVLIDSNWGVLRT